MALPWQVWDQVGRVGGLGVSNGSEGYRRQEGAGRRADSSGRMRERPFMFIRYQCFMGRPHQSRTPCRTRGQTASENRTRRQYIRCSNTPNRRGNRGRSTTLGGVFIGLLNERLTARSIRCSPLHYFTGTWVSTGRYDRSDGSVRGSTSRFRPHYTIATGGLYNGHRHKGVLLMNFCHFIVSRHRHRQRNMRGSNSGRGTGHSVRYPRYFVPHRFG